MDTDKYIPKGNYEGYLWMSNESYIGNSGDTAPLVVDGEFEGRKLVDGENPFVLEAQLFDVDNKKSYSVKFVDGKYLFNVFETSEDEIEQSDDIKEYMSKRMGGTCLRFMQRWEAKENEDCLGMNVLVPAEMVFIGFKH